MLQRQYEVHTYLAEVRNVVFVAERVPPPPEIDADWVRRHDWIIARALKASSFRPALQELTQDTEDVDPLEGAGDDPYREMVDAARDNFASFETAGAGQGQGGLSLPDIYAEPQRQYDSHLREGAARANRLREIRRRRLFDHIRDNILHYCQAIWAAENPQQRLLRYRKEGRAVPVQWQGTLLSAATDLSGLEEGAFETLAPNGVTVPVVDLLDPTGPIGFTGNTRFFRSPDPPNRRHRRRSRWITAAIPSR